MANTARAIITSALKKIGAIASGETPQASELQDGLIALQGMIDSWSNNDLLAHTETTETFNLVASQQTYTIGAGGDFATTRPMEILWVSVVDANGFELTVNPLKFEQWAGLGLRTTQSTLATEYYFETAFPLAKIHLVPIPSEAREIIIRSRKPFASLTSVNDTLSLPPGYDDALIFNLALELVDDYGGQVSALTMQKAEEKLHALKCQNLSKSIPYASSDEGNTYGQSSVWTMRDFLKGGS